MFFVLALGLGSPYLFLAIFSGKIKNLTTLRRMDGGCKTYIWIYSCWNGDLFLVTVDYLKYFRIFASGLYAGSRYLYYFL